MTGEGHELPSPAEAGRRYDQIYARSPLADRPELYRWIVGLAGVGPRTRVLDIACGIGGGLQAIAAAGAEPHGLDVSRTALAGARAACPAARLTLADGARLPFADRSFSTVFNLGNLEHFTDLAGGIDEMRRVLSEQGRAWVLLPNLFYSGAIWRAIRHGTGPDHHQPIDRFATRREWQDLLEAGGLTVVRWYPYHKGKWWKRLLPRELAWHFLFETKRGPRSAKAALAPLGRVRS